MSAPVLISSQAQVPFSAAARIADRFGPLLTRSELAGLPPMTPLITDTLDRGTFVVLAGPWGSGKSLVAGAWSWSIAAGLPWERRSVDTSPGAGRVLYIAGEGAYGLDARLRAWERTHNVRVPDGLITLPYAVNVMQRTDVRLVADLVAELAIDLVVVDTLSRCMVGADENAAKDMSTAVGNLDLTRDAGATVLVVHHTGKDRSTVRGSSALEAAADTVYQTDGNGLSVTLRRTKRKDGPRDDEHRFTIEPVPGTESVILSASGNAPSSRDVILSAYLSAYRETGATKAQLRMASGLAPATFHRALSALVTDGKLVDIGTEKRPHYRLGET